MTRSSDLPTAPVVPDYASDAAVPAREISRDQKTSRPLGIQGGSGGANPAQNPPKLNLRRNREDAVDQSFSRSLRFSGNS